MTSAGAIYDQEGLLIASAGPRSSKLRFYSKLVCALVFGLIFKGALVTSHGAGLSVPDWPTSYGENMFLFPPSKWLGGIFYEHLHRLYASVVGALTLVLAAWIWMVEKRKWVRITALLSVFVVVLQGVLGGLTVLYRLPTWISAAHGALGQTFFLLTLFIAYVESAEFEAVGGKFTLTTLSRTALWMLALLYTQLFIGAVMRHSDSGLAVLDFPKMGGFWFPVFGSEMMSHINEARHGIGLGPVGVYQAALHIAHRALGLGVLLTLTWFSCRILSAELVSKSTRTIAGFILFVVWFQVALGIWTVYSLRQPYITSFHVLGGATLLGLVFFCFLRLSVSGRKT